ncbi:hypothetical protein NX722_17175 [Endozoicomonas gorgoniicola]|uniref:Uncharacterized protein n=1 Tax=Endozoicomonas gorgoniicola TaxID=1234144 RepID=A0ABT3MY75_9GAMM|nr:hypothetical protein [Endozoicomonas gorgoniicola]MCW7554319.1 hypothetical protein [Endozoicomonas gorgoniicola]
MSIENINDRPKPADPRQDTQVAPGLQDKVEEKLTQTFASARSQFEEMLQFNFGVIKELLDTIAAIHPHRPDMALGKQPELAAIEADNETKQVAVAPVGDSSSENVVKGLKQVEGMMASQDIKLQELYDQLTLSRSGRKPDLSNQGREFERLKSIIIQAEGRMNQALSSMPETLPDIPGETVTSMMPEFIDALNGFDDSFRTALEAVRHEIELARQAGAL